jgi:hypothetical protein
MSYSVMKADKDSAREILENTFYEAGKVFRKYSPWGDIVADNLKALETDEHSYILFDPNGRPLVLFGIKPGEYSVMWCTPREDMTQRDNVAFLRRGVKLVQGWYEDFGTIYVPVHKEWEAVKDLVLFLGFTILGDGGIAVYDGESDD